MLYKSTLLAEASGSVDGLVFSHNRGGRYIRRRQIPTNPNSSYQQAIRSIFADGMGRWRDVLTAAQRTAWTLYAANTPVVNALGETIYLTGPQMYIRTNVVSVLAYDVWFDDGPTTFGLTELSPLTMTVTAPAATISVAFDNTDEWAGQADGFLVMFIGKPQSPTINFFKGPFRKADGLQGNSVPPASPHSFANPHYPVTAGQLVYCRFIACDEQGRLSVPQIISDVAA